MTPEERVAEIRLDSESYYEPRAREDVRFLLDRLDKVTAANEGLREMLDRCDAKRDFLTGERDYYRTLYDRARSELDRLNEKGTRFPR